MFLGIEIGGTKLQLGVGAGESTDFVDFKRLHIDAAQGASGILAQIEQTAKPLIQQHDIKRVGYGFGGPLEGATGTIKTSHQIHGWDQFPLKDWTEKTLGVPAVVRNDCDSAAIAELKFGAGAGKNSLFYITVGTGVGGGLVLNSQLVGTDRPAIAEIGHLRPGLDALESSQTVESMASGRGLENYVRQQLQPGTDLDALGDFRSELLLHCGNDPENVSGKIIAATAAEGNQISLDALKRGTQAIGWAAAQVLTLVAPEVVVIGGGVSLIGEELFFEPVRRYAEQYVFPQLKGKYEIAPAGLGEDVVVHGALVVARQG